MPTLSRLVLSDNQQSANEPMPPVRLSVLSVLSVLSLRLLRSLLSVKMTIFPSNSASDKIRLLHKMLMILSANWRTNTTSSTDIFKSYVPPSPRGHNVRSEYGFFVLMFTNVTYGLWFRFWSTGKRWFSHSPMLYMTSIATGARANLRRHQHPSHNPKW